MVPPGYQSKGEGDCQYLAHYNQDYSDPVFIKKCSLRVKANSVLCVQCGKWIHGRCAGVTRLTPMFSRSPTCIKCERNIGEAAEQEEELCQEVETVQEFTYLGDSLSIGGFCDAAVTGRTRCG